MAMLRVKQRTTGIAESSDLSTRKMSPTSPSAPKTKHTHDGEPVYPWSSSKQEDARVAARTARPFVTGTRRHHKVYKPGWGPKTLTQDALGYAYIQSITGHSGIEIQ